MPRSPRLRSTRHRALVLAALVAAPLAGCTSLLRMLRSAVEPPRVVFQKADLTGIDLQAATVTAHFDVVNPNPVGLSLSTVAWAFSLDGKKLLDGTTKDGLKLAPEGRAPLVVPIRVPFEAIPNLFETFANKEEAPYAVEGRAGVRTPIGELQVPVRWSGMLPIPKLPVVKLAAASVQSVSLTGARLGVQLQVTNPNVFALPLEALTANVSVAGQSLARIGLDAPRPMAAKDTVLVNLPIDVSFASAGLATASALQAGTARLGLTGEARVGGTRLPLDLATVVGR